jgi:phosphatidylinositol alpha-1,6-mannosyltransferase
MQRVATELFGALQKVGGIEVRPLVLRTTWERVHFNTPFFLLQSAAEISRLARSRAIDRVLFSSMVTASLAVWRRRVLHEAGVKAAAIVHGQDVTTPFGPYQRFVPRVFDALDLVMPVSRATGAQCLQRGLPESKMRVVPNGIDLTRFAQLESRVSMRAELVAALGHAAQPLPQDALLLCSVGRQVKRKGFAWFIEHVLPRLPESVHYWLAGDGPETETLRQTASRRGVTHRVRLLGRIADAHLALLYRGADLFIMPNIPVPGTMEGFGVVMLEAGLGGLPTIAARLEGIQDVIAEGLNGRFVESGDAEGFTRAIRHYHEHRSELKSASEAAARYTAETYSWDTVARLYIQALDKL